MMINAKPVFFACAMAFLAAINAPASAASSNEGQAAMIRDKSNQQALAAIVINAGETRITADLFDNATARDFLSKLPMELSMTEYGDREYYGKPSETLSTDASTVDHFEKGDVTYWVPGGSFAVFYDTPDGNSLDDLIIMGRIRSDLTDFKGLGSSSLWRIEQVEPEAAR